MKKLYLIIILFIFTLTAALSADLEVIRDEFQVNQSTFLKQDHATVSMTQNGDSLITWHDFGGIDGDGLAAVGRLFDSIGNPLTDEFIINETTTGNQRLPDVDSNGENIFVIVWNSFIEGEGNNVFAKLISSLGTVLVNEYKVNDAVSESKIHPDVTMYSNGDFIVIWDQEEQGQLNYYVKLFDSYGTLIDGPFKVNKILSVGPSEPGGKSGLPDIAVNETGDAVAVWERISSTDVSIAGRLFNIYTKKASKEILIDPPAGGIIQSRPMVDINEAGDIIVTWIEYQIADATYDVYAMKYHASINKWGNKISPHHSPDGIQALPAVKIIENGQFVIVWTSDNDVYMRFYNAREVPLSKEIIVNSTQEDIQKRPAIDLFEYLDHISMIITWEGYGQGVDNYGIYSKIGRINY